MVVLFPTLLPFSFHWYTGVPPLAGVAVKVTDVPAHIAPDGDAAILKLGVSTGLTDIVTVLEVAVTGLAQVALDVITQVIVFPFARPAFT